MNSRPARIEDKPHPAGDECVACGLEGWKASRHTTADGKPITVAEGYGNFEGYLLVADGHLDDEPYTPDGSFRSDQVSRRVVAVGDMTFAD